MISQISPQRSVSENSLVAMDFSGTIGRVIDNPVEAQSAALEEAHAWRVSITTHERPESGAVYRFVPMTVHVQICGPFFVVVVTEKKSAHEHFGEP